ncbi:DUF3949 domain-containing protein [Bacillus weihaiensis]|nr:DUF3949 domain-containing protein [Bacillus weihaiensis]
MLKIFLGMIGVYLLLSLALLPVQYKYLSALREKEMVNKQAGKTQGDMYDKMNTGDLFLHENAQGNPLFLLANILASILIRIKHR